MLTIHAIKDQNGKVIATFEKNAKGPAIEPVLHHGHTVVQMSVAEDYEKNLKAFYDAHG